MRLLTILLALSLVGCGNMHRHGRMANVTGPNVLGPSESCIDGVTYIQFRSGVSVKYTREGKIATC
jgi:hypothetical protein